MSINTALQEPAPCPSLIRSTGTTYYRFYGSVNTKRIQKKETILNNRVFYLKAGQRL